MTRVIAFTPTAVVDQWRFPVSLPPPIFRRARVPRGNGGLSVRLCVAGKNVAAVVPCTRFRGPSSELQRPSCTSRTTAIRDQRRFWRVARMQIPITRRPRLNTAAAAFTVPPSPASSSSRHPVFVRKHITLCIHYTLFAIVNARMHYVKPECFCYIFRIIVDFVVRDCRNEDRNRF